MESDASLQRLSTDGFADKARAILVATRGMSDISTRVFCHALVGDAGRLRPFAGCASDHWEGRTGPFVCL